MRELKVPLLWAVCGVSAGSALLVTADLLRSERAGFIHAVAVVLLCTVCAGLGWLISRSTNARLATAIRNLERRRQHQAEVDRAAQDDRAQELVDALEQVRIRLDGLDARQNQIAARLRAAEARIVLAAESAALHHGDQLDEIRMSLQRDADASHGAQPETWND